MPTDYSLYSELMLDSGAFSAWNSGAEVNLKEYTEFCLEKIDKFNWFVNLDCLPGSPNKRITKDQREFSAKKGWENYRYMLKAGIPKDRLIPVYHQGEDFKWLRRMIKRKIPYIGLSPANDKTTAQKIKWLDESMLYATNKRGFPLAKFHGFAVTSFRIMTRYPWYSVDSASWIFMAAYGSVVVPRKRKDNFCYTIPPLVLSTSRRQKEIKGKDNHISKLSPIKQKHAIEYIKSKKFELGKSYDKDVSIDYKLNENEVWVDRKKGIVEVIEIQGISNSTNFRYILNAMYFNDLEKHFPKWPPPFKHKNRMKGMFSNEDIFCRS